MGPEGEQRISETLRPYLEPRKEMCPTYACSLTPSAFPQYEQPMTLRTLIMHLNDAHHWSREEIADWLDKEELGRG